LCDHMPHIPKEREHRDMTIIEAAREQKRLKTLIKAMKCLELNTVLSGEELFTLFAPTDDAFARLPSETIEILFKEKNLLNEVLTYHIAPGRAMLAYSGDHTSVKSVQGESLSITKSKNCVTVNDAKILQKDISCSNGIIHVIDSVLFPEVLQSADAVSIKNIFQKEGKA